MKELLAMLESVKAPSYLIANPFSKLGNEDLNGTVTNEVFFSNFLVMSLKTYERFASFVDTANDPNQNAVFVTGFRGSGKTTFAKSLQAIVNGEYFLPHYADKLDDEHEPLPTDEGDIRDNHSNKETCKNISRFLDLDCNDNIGSLDWINKCVDQINMQLRGKAIYINFEVDTYDTIKPIEQKLSSNLSKLIDKRIIQQDKNIVFSQLGRIYNTLRSSFSSFEKSDSHVIKDFFSFISSVKMQGCSSYADVEDDIRQIISPMAIHQLLCLILMIDIVLSDTNESKPKLFYLFDNIDIIYDNFVLNDFINDFIIFLENISPLVSKLNESRILSRSFQFYEDFCFAFFMRETSSMVISDHFNDRLQNSSKHFDISSDVDKGVIISKKYHFLLEHNDEYNNKKLVSSVKQILEICNDNFVRQNIYSLFNNDYKRAVSCLSTISIEHLNKINEMFILLASGHDYNKHGARGILFRLIFDHFMRQGYFNQIGVSHQVVNRYKLTPSRIILTYLQNIQFFHNSSFLENDEDSVALSLLGDEFRSVFSNQENVGQDILVSSLWGMYSLRTSKYWSHLVTFDCIKSISREEMISSLNGNKCNSLGFGIGPKIRITCAGRSYVKFISVHFEFFASRFCKQSDPLFSRQNADFNREKRRYNFEILLEAVYNAVEKCCLNLDYITKKTYNERLGISCADLLNSNFSYQDKSKGLAFFHAERILHQHIRYIDCYRLHLVNDKYKNNVIDINKRIICFINKYLDLLDKYNYFSETSKILYGELRYCIEYIEKEKYNVQDIEISRSSYNELFGGRKES